MKNSAVLIAVLCAMLISGGNAFSMDKYGPHTTDFSDGTDLAVVGRAVNIQGLTGLLVTNSAYTLPEGKIAIGLSATLENSDVPNFSIAQGALTVTMGMTDRLEVGLKGKMIATNLGSADTREVGTGDADLLVKYRFASQGDTLPAWALGFGYTFPTGNTTKGFSEVKYEGLKLMVIGTSEKKILDDSFIGVYFEAQAVYNDEIHREGVVTNKDAYGVVNAGLLFPVSDDNRLQLGLEYNKVFNKDIVTLYEGNYSALTPSLRYAGESFNVQAGVQFLSRDKTQAGTSTADQRLIGSISYVF